MASIRFEGGEFTLTEGSLTARFRANEDDLKTLRDQLLERYPMEPEPTTEGPLREVTLAEARPGDIATFEPNYSDRKYVCTLRTGEYGALMADKWLTANKMNEWCIRNHTGDDGGCMKDLHIWRWDGVEEAVELPDPPTVAGLYITATSDQVLYNDGDACENWSRPRGARWSTGNTYEDWEVVVRDLGPERLPLKLVQEKQ